MVTQLRPYFIMYLFIIPFQFQVTLTHFMIVRYTSESYLRIANEVYSHKVIHILYSVRRKGADGTSPAEWWMFTDLLPIFYDILLGNIYDILHDFVWIGSLSRTRSLTLSSLTQTLSPSLSPTHSSPYRDISYLHSHVSTDCHHNDCLTESTIGVVGPQWNPGEPNRSYS